MEIKHNFKELVVWQKSKALAKNTFLLLKDFPNDERFELVSQMRRAMISIPSIIAEGTGRNSNNDFCRFPDIALSSAYELETQIILSYDLGYLTEKVFTNITTEVQEVQKMLFGLKRSFIKTKERIIK
jgi:four helix bundle protein